MPEVFQRILRLLHSLAFREAELALENGPATGIVHPAGEIYELPYRVGIELLSHLNAVGDTSEKVIMALAALCGGQHHMLLASAEPLRQGISSELAIEAADVLATMPVKLPEVQTVLAALGKTSSVPSELPFI